jgi:hypothetical protein
VSDLISSDPTGFEVTFQWTEGKSFPGKGVFVWREAGSSYRWDGIARDTDGTERGTFSLVRWAAGSDRTDFADNTVASCEWFGSSNTTTVGIGCDGGESADGGDPSEIVAQSLRAAVSGRMPDRIITSHHAHCYSFEPIVGDGAAFCADSQTGVPLYFKSSDAYGVPEELTAVAVSDITPDVMLPADILSLQVALTVTRSRPDLLLPVISERFLEQ